MTAGGLLEMDGFVVGRKGGFTVGPIYWVFEKLTGSYFLFLGWSLVVLRDSGGHQTFGMRAETEVSILTGSENWCISITRIKRGPARSSTDTMFPQQSVLTSSSGPLISSLGNNSKAEVLIELRHSSLRLIC